MAFLDAINPQTLMERVRPLIAERSRTTVIVGTAAAAAVVIAAALWFWGSSYAVLYAGLSGEEGGRAIAELQKLNIPYRITEGGRVIQVPASEVGRARLQLAARGVAKKDADEWAILDNESLGVSPFVEQVHYVRGIETALSRTVGEVDGVVSAKVKLALPKETILGDSPKPSGSVLLRLRPGTTLTTAQVTGIVGLVASSVPGLARDRVTVVDQSGTVLNPNGDGVTMQAPQQLELTREVNRRYETLITDLLVPVLGRGNFRISSDADIDFSQSKESLVRYGQSHVLSQDETTHVRGSESDQPIGIPGALSNRKPETPTTVAPEPTQNQQAAQTNPPGQATATQPGTPPAKPAEVTPSDTHKTTNFDIDKSVEFREHPSWRLRGINIAVLVNNPTGSSLPPERLQSVDKLVSSAIGSAQNPHVTVVDLPFEPNDAPIAAGPWWREPWAGAVEQNALLAAAGLLGLFGGLFPLLRRVTGAHTAVAAATAVKTAAIRAGLSVDSQEASDPLLRPLPQPNRQPQDIFSIEAETVQTLVRSDPARTAQVIRGWIAGGRDSAPKRA